VDRSTAIRASAPAAVAVPGGVLVVWYQEQVTRIMLEEDAR